MLAKCESHISLVIPPNFYNSRNKSPNNIIHITFLATFQVFVSLEQPFSKSEFTVSPSVEKATRRVGEMTQQLGALINFAQGLSSVSGAHMVTHNHL